MHYLLMCIVPQKHIISRLLKPMDNAIKHFPLHTIHELTVTSSETYLPYSNNTKQYVPKRGKNELEDCLDRMDVVFYPIQNQ